MNVVSFGGGTNSTAMIIGMYLHKIPIDLILFADTGGEQPHTYEFIETFNGWLEKHGLPQITSVQYHDKDGNRLTLEQECINSGTLPSIAYGFKRCSLKHKIGTQEKFCNNYQPCKEVWASGQRVQKYIGYDAGETRRIQHAAPIDEADKKYEKHYPLYEWGWTREECVRVIERAGLPKPGKSSCFFCPSMKKKEIQALWENYPDLFQRAIALEHGSAARNVNVKGLGRACRRRADTGELIFYQEKLLYPIGDQIKDSDYIRYTARRMPLRRSMRVLRRIRRSAWRSRIIPPGWMCSPAWERYRARSPGTERVRSWWNTTKRDARRA